MKAKFAVKYGDGCATEFHVDNFSIIFWQGKDADTLTAYNIKEITIKTIEEHESPHNTEREA
jgi:hypothetical protein